MEKLTQYRSIARFVKKAIDLSMQKERSTFPYPQKALALLDLFQKRDRPYLRKKN